MFRIGRLARAIALLSPVLWPVIAPASAQTAPGPGRPRVVTVDSAGAHTTAGPVPGGVATLPGSPGTTVIVANRLARTVDCRGGILQVDGNSNVLHATACVQVIVRGNGNTVTAGYVGPGRIDALGNRNRITWHAPVHTGVDVTDAGTGNTVTRAP